jgi:uncharacterized protein YqgV (UPF0045/DUF77 family)
LKGLDIMMNLIIEMLEDSDFEVISAPFGTQIEVNEIANDYREFIAWCHANSLSAVVNFSCTAIEFEFDDCFVLIHAQ